MGNVTVVVVTAVRGSDGAVGSSVGSSGALGGAGGTDVGSGWAGSSSVGDGSCTGLDAGTEVGADVGDG
ncbi:hypothetical protein CSX11_08145, partial [Mycobacterium goodii]